MIDGFGGGAIVDFGRANGSQRSHVCFGRSANNEKMSRRLKMRKMVPIYSVDSRTREERL